MARTFDIPGYYRSVVISQVKQARRSSDSRKKDFSPSVLDLGPVRFKIARHFGFCFGVENAIEIAYRALEENPNSRVFLLSEMIHNSHVNDDLQSRGVKFLLDTDGTQLIPFEELRPDDVVVVPAFGTTLELFEQLSKIGLDPYRYNTTCPFVEKVWNRAKQLGEKGFSVVVHGKNTHEETRATFSHAQVTAPTVVIRDIQEAHLLARYLRAELPFEQFYSDFADRYSEGFRAEEDLNRIGVVNQTTMLATETQEICDILRAAVAQRRGEKELAEYFADTRDTLCYATNDNQSAVYGLIESGGDLAIVVGGYNSSNTSHLVELCEEVVPTFHIRDAEEIHGRDRIRHLDQHSGELRESDDWLPEKDSPLEILITAGASCPDILVDQVISKVASIFQVEESIPEALKPFLEAGGGELVQLANS